MILNNLTSQYVEREPSIQRRKVPQDAFGIDMPRQELLSQSVINTMLTQSKQSTSWARPLKIDNLNSLEWP